VALDVETVVSEREEDESRVRVSSDEDGFIAAMRKQRIMYKLQKSLAL